QEYSYSSMTNTVLAIAGLIVILLLIWFFWNRYGAYGKEQAKRIRWKDIGIALLFFIAARIIAIVGTSLNEVLYDEEETANDAVLSNLTDDSTFVAYFLLFILAISLLIPMLEELTFRGIFRNLLFKKHMFWLPLLLTSLVFGSLHLSDNVISFAIYF